MGNSSSASAEAGKSKGDSASASTPKRAPRIVQVNSPRQIDVSRDEKKPEGEERLSVASNVSNNDNDGGSSKASRTRYVLKEITEPTYGDLEEKSPPEPRDSSVGVLPKIGGNRPSQAALENNEKMWASASRGESKKSRKENGKEQTSRNSRFNISPRKLPHSGREEAGRAAGSRHNKALSDVNDMNIDTEVLEDVPRNAGMNKTPNQSGSIKKKRQNSKSDETYVSAWSMAGECRNITLDEDSVQSLEDSPIEETLGFERSNSSTPKVTDKTKSKSRNHSRARKSRVSDMQKEEEEVKDLTGLADRGEAQMLRATNIDGWTEGVDERRKAGRSPKVRENEVEEFTFDGD